MSNCFRFKATHEVSAKEIAALRGICPYSISELQRRVRAEESLLDIPVLSGEWPVSKAKIVLILQSIENGALPLAVFSVEIEANSLETEEPLSIEQARQRLQFLREISLEQDMHTQLEEGHISSPDEYVAMPENDA